MPPHAAVADGRSASSTQWDAAGALCLLRHPRELSALGRGAPSGPAHVAQVVVAAVVDQLRYLAPVRAVGTDLPVTCAPDYPPQHLIVRKAAPRRTECANRARSG